MRKVRLSQLLKTLYSQLSADVVVAGCRIAIHMRFPPSFDVVLFEPGEITELVAFFCLRHHGNEVGW